MRFQKVLQLSWKMSRVIDSSRISMVLKKADVLLHVELVGQTICIIHC